MLFSINGFLETLFELLPTGVGRFLEVRMFSEGEGDKVVQSNWYDTQDVEFSLSTVGHETVFGNKRKFGCFVGYNLRDRERGTKDSVTRLTAVYADVDIYKTDHTLEDLQLAVAKSPLKPTLVISSGGGAQLVWILRNVESNKELWRRAQVGVAEFFKELGSDGAVVTDESRVLRIPGTFNWKTGEPRPCDLLGINKSVTLHEIVEAYPVDDDVFEKKVGRLGMVPEEIDSGGGAEHEGRNTTLFKYGCLFREKGFKGAVIEAAIYAANQEHCNPPLDDEEVARILDSVMKYERGDKVDEIADVESSREGLLRSFGRLRDEVKGRPDEIIYGVNRREVSMVQAQPNVGKSTLMLNIAVSLACGRQFFDLVPGGAPRRVAYMDGENSSFFLKADLEVMTESLTPAEQRLINENLSIIVDHEINEADPKLSNKAHFDLILSELKAFDPDLIVVDTVASWFELRNENDNSEVERVVGTACRRLAKQCDSAVIILHHVGKTKEEKTFSPMYKGRGASAFQAFTRTIINLDPVLNASAEHTEGATTISFSKCKSRAPMRAKTLYVNRAIRWFGLEPWNLLPEQNEVAVDEAVSLLADASRRPGGFTATDFGTYCALSGVQKTDAQQRAILDWAIREDYLIKSQYLHYPGLRLTRYIKERESDAIKNVVEGNGPPGSGETAAAGGS